MLNELFSMFRMQQPVPYLILAFCFVGWVIIFERLIVLQLLYRVNFSKFNGTIRKMLAAGDTERARNFCLATSKTGLPHIAFKAIETYERDNFKVRMVVSEETLSFLPRIRRRISQLPTLAACAVLLGAFAAVSGVWDSFHIADGLESGLKSFAFTRGLSAALAPLGLSLICAVILMLPYGILDAIAARLEGDFEHSLTIVLNILAPEMQPVFASASAVQVQGVAPATASHKEDDASASEHEEAEASGGSYEESSSSSGRLDAVPDEEEII